MSDALGRLIEMLERAHEAKRDLDALIAIQVGVSPGYQGDGVWDCPRYTSDIHRALELIPKEPDYSIHARDMGRSFTVEIARRVPEADEPNEKPGWWFGGNAVEHVSLPIAVCIAALKTLAEVEAQIIAKPVAA